MPDRRSFLKLSLGALGACAAGLSTAGTLLPDKGNTRTVVLDTPTGPLRGQMLDDAVVFKGIPYPHLGSGVNRGDDRGHQGSSTWSIAL
jgi:hypothetical protein